MKNKKINSYFRSNKRKIIREDENKTNSTSSYILWTMTLMTQLFNYRSFFLKFKELQVNMKTNSCFWSTKRKFIREDENKTDSTSSHIFWTMTLMTQLFNYRSFTTRNSHITWDFSYKFVKKICKKRFFFYHLF